MSRRRQLDFYETGEAAVKALRKRVKISGTVIEPCNGLGAISRHFGDCVVITGDIDPEKTPMHVCDAREFRYEATVGSVTEKWLQYQLIKPWVVTNPPFSIFMPILKRPVELGLPTCFLLRLSALEPTTRDEKDINRRGEWLAGRPPEGVIVLPRYSYTGDGKTDSVTSAWMCWNLPPSTWVGPPIQCAPEGE